MSTDTTVSTENAEAAWTRVREAITERWPHINRHELYACENDTSALIDCVKQHVQASDEEVESVIREFAPQEPIMERVTHAASSALSQASDSVQAARMRTDALIAERPTESVLTSFIAGIIVGATVTALLCNSQPEPTTWERIRHRRQW